jgi:hypothetical protein
MNEKPATDLKFTKLDPPEKVREYLYPNPADPKNPMRIRFENVTAICIRDSGSNRLEMADGTKAVVLPGFVAVLLTVDSWTF